MAANPPGSAPASDKWVPYRRAQLRESPPEPVTPDALPRIDRCRAHDTRNDPGADSIDQSIR